MTEVEQRILELTQRVHFIESQLAPLQKLDGKQFYTSIEVARILGVSIYMVKKLVSDGAIASIKTCGGQLRVRKADLLQYIDQRGLHE